jgi:hypothetical protein
VGPTGLTGPTGRGGGAEVFAEGTNPNGSGVTQALTTTRAQLPIIATVPLNLDVTPVGATAPYYGFQVTQAGLYLVGYSLTWTASGGATLAFSLATPTNATDIPGTISRSQITAAAGQQNPTKLALVRLSANQTVYLMGKTTTGSATVSFEPAYSVSLFAILLNP